MAGYLKESTPCFMRCRLECDRCNNEAHLSHLVEAAVQILGALAFIVAWTSLHPTLSLSGGAKKESSMGNGLKKESTWTHSLSVNKPNNNKQAKAEET